MPSAIVDDMTSDQRPEEALASLKREVLPPRNGASSLGIIAVSAVAMLFAMSSSLLLFHASSLRASTRVDGAVYRPVRRDPPAPPRISAPPTLESRVDEPTDACKGPVYRATVDGRAEAVFELCPPRGGALKRILEE